MNERKKAEIYVHKCVFEEHPEFSLLSQLWVLRVSCKIIRINAPYYSHSNQATRQFVNTLETKVQLKWLKPVHQLLYRFMSKNYYIIWLIYGCRIIQFWITHFDKTVKAKKPYLFIQCCLQRDNASFVCG